MPNLWFQHGMKNVLQICFVPDMTMETEQISTVLWTFR